MDIRLFTLAQCLSATVLGKRRHDADLQDISAGEVWLQFRRTWWGDPGKKVDAFRERTSSSFFLHIEQEEVRMSFKLHYDYLFVREEYLLFAKRCRNLRPDTTFLGCLILGQPGIGPLTHTVGHTPTSFLTDDHVSLWL